MNKVIKPWMVFLLIGGLAGNVLLSGILIMDLSRFDYSKQQMDEAEALKATLQIEVETLTKQKDTLTPAVADWQYRLKEKSAAEAFLATLDAKQRQSESDIVEATRRLDDANRALIDTDKQKADLVSTVERLKAERDALTKSNTDTKILARQAEEAEHRISTATIALASFDARRKQLETDTSAAQTRFEQIQKEADDLRQAREKLNTDLTALRQQIQTQKDLLATFDQKAADLKALQTAIQQEEQTSAKLQQASTMAEARANEMDSRFNKTTSELSQLANRLEQVRKDAADAETRLDTAKITSQRAESDFALAQKLFTETQASQVQLAGEQTKIVAQIAASKKELEQVRKDTSEAEPRRDTAKADAQKADADLAAARAQLQVYGVKQAELTREVSQLASEQTKTVAQIAASKKELEQVRKDTSEAEPRRDTAKADAQKADADLTAARAQLQVYVVKQGELTREVSRLEATSERLKKEKEVLEKEIGRQEAQLLKNPSEALK